uniref:Uncharacterized protein n=1 Tax=Arundo donax TaxID=35708 RepID=A0A0A8YQ87_ARUDO
MICALGFFQAGLEKSILYVTVETDI